MYRHYTFLLNNEQYTNTNFNYIKKQEKQKVKHLKHMPQNVVHQFVKRNTEQEVNLKEYCLT